MTIPKNTNKAKQVIANAHDIRCFSLGENFQGRPLHNSCSIWKEGNIVAVGQHEFLMYELNMRHAKLYQDGSGYRIDVHSNLWYEFKA